MKKIFTLIASALFAICANAATEVDYTVDFTKVSSFTGWKADCVKDIKYDADGMHITNDAIQANFWDFQIWICDGATLTVGETYDITVLAKATGEGTAKVRYKVGNWDGGITGDFDVVTGGEYKEYHIKGDAAVATNGVLIQFGDFIGTVSFKSVTISHEAAGAPIDDYMCTVDLSEAKANSWDSQVMFNLPNTLEVGTKYDVYFSVKGSVAGTEELGSFVEDTKSTNKDQWGNSADLQYTGNFPVTTDWAQVCIGEIDGAFPYNRLVLQIGKYAGTLYFDNIKIVNKTTGAVDVIDFKTGVVGSAEKRSYHNHVTVGKAASDCPTFELPTAIKNINVATGNNMMYNLAGQRVNNANGIVIMNGKKVRF